LVSGLWVPRVIVTCVQLLSMCSGLFAPEEQESTDVCAVRGRVSGELL
jgi:hypothetical protein